MQCDTVTGVCSVNITYRPVTNDDAICVDSLGKLNCDEQKVKRAECAVTKGHYQAMSMILFFLNYHKDAA